MKIVSWNVAGLRACLNKGFDRFFDPYGYYEYLFPAEKKGYSGTMIYTKEKPISVIYGIGVEEYDKEGRVITAEYQDFYLVNCYVPNSKRELERLPSRMNFEDMMRKYLKSLSQKKNVIYCGDLNVAHEEIDIKNPKANRRSAGFTDEERTKMTELLDSGFVDSFRYLYPDKVQYSWWSYLGHAREKGIGWRLDYFIVNRDFISHIKDSILLDSIEGSDHCPIELTF